MGERSTLQCSHCDMRTQAMHKRFSQCFVVFWQALINSLTWVANTKLDTGGAVFYKPGFGSMSSVYRKLEVMRPVEHQTLVLKRYQSTDIQAKRFFGNLCWATIRRSTCGSELFGISCCCWRLTFHRWRWLCYGVKCDIFTNICISNLP